jgi:hypothetical protein
LVILAGIKICPQHGAEENRGSLFIVSASQMGNKRKLKISTI